MSVKRYDLQFGLDGFCLVPKNHGKYTLYSDYDELRERVAWMLECEDYLLILNPTNRWRSMFAHPELRHIVNAARKAVEEML